LVHTSQRTSLVAPLRHGPADGPVTGCALWPPLRASCGYQSLEVGRIMTRRDDARPAHASHWQVRIDFHAREQDRAMLRLHAYAMTGMVTCNLESWP
jgi:hypothetical protein